MAAGNRRRRQRPDFSKVRHGRRRNCAQTGKRSWHSQADALEAAASLARAAGGSKPIRAYLCNFCGCWHLTSKPKR